MYNFFVNDHHWFYIGLFFSTVWGWRSGFLFIETPTTGWSHKHPKQAAFWMWYYHFVFNFVGSMAGWGCFYILVVRVHSIEPGLKEFNWGDIILFMFSVIGLTGHLPQAFFGLVQAFGKLAEALASKVSGK